MKVGVIILNWNGLADTRECLHSLLPAPAWAQIFVVDNGSRDESVGALRQEFGDQITLIETGANLLFAGGNNVGIEQALSSACDAVLLLNNDTLIEPSTLQLLFEAAQRHPASLLCPKILYATDVKRLWYAGGIWKGGRIAHRGIREQDYGQYNQEERTQWGTGCALWIPRGVIEKVGKLDDDFKLYYEDVEFCLRANSFGVETVYVPTSRVWHKVSASLGGHGSVKKQKRKFVSLGLMLEKIGASPVVIFGAYFHFFFLDPMRALFAKLFGLISR